jgi:hypothetical protein
VILQSVIPSLRPLCVGWVQWPVLHPDTRAAAADITRWYNRAHEVQVLSAVEVIGGEIAGIRRPEYHVSVSRLRWQADHNQRASDSLARWALKQFGFDGAEEDNHVPHGIVRNYFRPVAEPLIGQECACKETEPAIKEDRGDYIWRDAGRI